MPDANPDPKPVDRAPASRIKRAARPQHAVPSLYAPSPRESVIAAGLAVALLSVLALVLAAAGGSANAERTHRPAAHPAVAAAPPVANALVAGLVPIEGPTAHAGGATPATAPVGGTGSPTLLPGIGLGFGGSYGGGYGSGYGGTAGGTGAASSLAASGIPATALAAYQQAVARQDLLTPGCRISWPLLAGIGRIESNHGRFAGAVLHTDGLSTPPVIGIPLNGNGTAVIRDTDHGRLDGDAVYDRAVGPMQFIPSTWATWGVDADHDGVKNPYDIFDAAAAAAAYLCAAGRDLSTYHGQVAAILSYNHSLAYVSSVMGVERVYASGDQANVPVVPTAPGPGDSGPIASPTLPPVDPGRPRGVGTTTARSHPKPTHSSGPSSSRSSRPSTSHPSSTHPSSSHTPTTPPTKTSSTPSCPPSSSPSSSSPTSPTSSSSTPSGTPTTTPPGCGSSSSTSPKAADTTTAAAEHADTNAPADETGNTNASIEGDASSAQTTGDTAGASGS